jgi:hypothetical protein
MARTFTTETFPKVALKFVVEIELEAQRLPYISIVLPVGAPPTPTGPRTDPVTIKEGVLAVKARTFRDVRAFEAHRFPWTCSFAPGVRLPTPVLPVGPVICPTVTIGTVAF